MHSQTYCGTVFHMSDKNLTSGDWLTLRQADAEGPFSRRTLWKFIASGRLQAYRPLPKKILIRRSDLTRLIEASAVVSDLDQVDNILSGFKGSK